MPQGDDFSGSESPERRFGWVNHPLTSRLLAVAFVVLTVIVALWFIGENVLVGCFGGCGRDGCGVCSSVSNAPGS
jgi:hypothetical protein